MAHITFKQMELQLNESCYCNKYVSQSQRMHWARIHPNASYPAHVENMVQGSQVIWPHVYFQLTRCDHLDSIAAIHKTASSQ